MNLPRHTPQQIVETLIAQAAMQCGCRVISALDELPALLRTRVQLSASGQPVVLTESGQPAVDVTGQPLSIRQLVVDYVRSSRVHLDPTKRDLWPQ